jgi:hypothetical protein
VTPETISHVKALCKRLGAKRIGTGDHPRILIAFDRVSANSLLSDHSKVPAMMAEIGKIQLREIHANVVVYHGFPQCGASFLVI